MYLKCDAFDIGGRSWCSKCVICKLVDEWMLEMIQDDSLSPFRIRRLCMR